MPSPIACTPLTSPSAPSPTVAPSDAVHASPTLPLDVGNAPMAAATLLCPAPPAPADAAGLAAHASVLCRDEGLPAAIAWMKRHAGSWPDAVRARVMQSLTLALPTDRAWQALRDAAVVDADAARSGLDTYRHALRALGHAMEAFDSPVLAGRTGFLQRSRALRATLGELVPAALPGPLRRAAADAAARLDGLVHRTRSDDLRLWLSACMDWQSALPAAASGLCADELPQLWFDYALDSEGWRGNEARQQFWTLAIVGSELLADVGHYQVDPASYDGAVIACLRRGDGADAVCTRFHLNQQPMLERWVQQVADRLSNGMRLRRDDSLPRW